MTTPNAATNTVNVTGQVEVVTVSSAMQIAKKTAKVTAVVAALATIGYFGYKFYQKGKVVVDVVTEGDAANAPAGEATN